MTRSQRLRVVEEKLDSQVYIRERWPDRIVKAKMQFCDVCGWCEKGLCHYGLLPVTVKGENCPYFRVSVLRV